MNAINHIQALGFQWPAADPFLFCVHHEDHYPAGNERHGIDPEHLRGRNVGQDFEVKDGFRLYHGRGVPGFPGHPHRGFETVTVVREGLVDHSDSHGAAGRYGFGDVQWMTAGSGLQHAEMFPLLYEDKDNPLELFQIWLNLPAKSKMVDPDFKMLWAESIPNVVHHDENGKQTLVEVIAGRIGDDVAPAPAPNSWAADPGNEVAIWNIQMDAGAEWQLPAASVGLNRSIYFYRGSALNVDGQNLPAYHMARLESDQSVHLQAEDEPVRILMLQGKAINEPVAQYGPFVMNTEQEIRDAFEDFRRTEFGGWPWPTHEPVHGERQRYAKYADGREEVPSSH